MNVSEVATRQLRWVALAVSVCATAVSILLAGYVGWQRGSNWLGVLPGLLAVLGAHLLLALLQPFPATYKRVGVCVWLVCVLMVMYGHASAFLLLQHQGGQHRAAEIEVRTTLNEPERSLSKVLAEHAKIQAELSRTQTSLAAKVVAECVDGCSALRARVTGLSGRLAALDAEVDEAKRWQSWQSELSLRQQAALVDPVAFALYRWVGVPEERTNLIAAAGYAIILEGIACLGWTLVLWPQSAARDQISPLVGEGVTSRVTPSPQVIASSPATVTHDFDSKVMQLVEAVKTGKLRPTVDGVMTHLSCARETARLLTKQLKQQLAVDGAS